MVWPNIFETTYWPVCDSSNEVARRRKPLAALAPLFSFDTDEQGLQMANAIPNSDSLATSIVAISAHLEGAEGENVDDGR